MLTPNDMDRNENPGGIFWRNVIITRQTEAAPHKDQKLFNFNIIGLVSSPTPNQDVDLIGKTTTTQSDMTKPISLRIERHHHSTRFFNWTFSRFILDSAEIKYSRCRAFKSELDQFERGALTRVDNWDYAAFLHTSVSDRTVFHRELCNAEWAVLACWTV